MNEPPDALNRHSPKIFRSWDIAAGAALGVLLFCIIYDISWLNPFNWHWCLATADSAQHFLGGMFFCKDEWRWPLGLFYGISGDSPHLISFVDGIPLAAFIAKSFCKLFSVKACFQYLGIFFLLNFMLQGIMAALLMRRMVSQYSFRLYGIIMILTAPIFLREVPVHGALTTQCLVLWALLLGFTDSKSGTALFYRWLLLLLLTLLIHPYFTGICGLLGIASFFRHYQSEHIINYGINAVIFGTAIGFAAYLLGYFSVEIVPGGGCAFAAGINLNGLFNSHDPTCSALIYPLPHSPLNMCVYGGAGYILLAVIGTPMLWRYCSRENVLDRYGVIFLALLGSALFALGNHVFLGTQVIFSIIFPPEILKLCSIFRANGRFFWPVWYMFLCGLWFALGNWKKQKTAVAAAGLVIFLQCFDLGNGLLAHTWAHYFSRSEEKRMEQIPSAVRKCDVRQVVYDYAAMPFIAPSLCAISCDSRVNTFYYAREVVPQGPQDSIDSLLKRGPQKKHLYFLTKNQKTQLLKSFPALSGRIISYGGNYLLLTER